VSDLVVVSDGGGSPGRNRLQWLNPSGGSPTGIRIKWNQSATSCAPPDPTLPGGLSDGTVSPDEPFSGAGVVQGYVHNGRPLNEEHCYTVWVQYGAAWSIPGATGRGRPFDSSGKVKWKYFVGTGTTTVAPPTVGADGVLVPSNDGFVHAMTRGPSGGTWPAPSWKPVNLGSPAQVRSPIVPLAGGSRAFYATQDGWVHAVDAKTGATLWQTQIATAAQAAPAGLFVAFTGAWDYLLVGTRQTNGNKVFALDPFTGGIVDVFPQGTEGGVSGLGMISGMAAVDYVGRRVYLGSRRGTLADATETLWCLKLGPPSDALQLDWKLGTPGDIDGSPVIRGNRLYVGDVDGKVWSLQLDGSGAYAPFDLGDGAIKGFPFPDRRNNDLFVATSTKVWGLTDNGSSIVTKWTNPVQGLDSPSGVLLKPGTNELYVGVRDTVPAGAPDTAGLLRIDVGLADPGPGAVSLALESFAAVVGAPSLDVGFSPSLLHVGSEGGVIYAVEVPF
jgi:outer membrane protein assembly factor BamB